MILLHLLFSLTVFAAPQDNPPKDPNETARELLDATATVRCEELLSEKPLSRHDITLITSGRETLSSRKKHEDAIEELFGPEGVLTKLGITTDKPTIIHFMRGQDMAAATANGRFPVTHVMDGASLLQGQGGGLIYEIAIPGKHVQHSMYRDDNPFADQYSILLHVAGHNHFTFHTKYSQQREFDLNREAITLDAMLNKYYVEIDREEVTLWYQFLESLGNAQDSLDGLHKQPSDFAPDLNRTPRRALLPNEPVDTMRHPRQPTRSVLQAFIGNLPSDIAPWKREIALQYEKLIRWQTSILNTKIVNEGFATFLMEMVPKHTSTSTFEFSNHFANLARGVTAPSLSNPYYLGVEGWRQIYRRFMRRPELKDKTSFEKDKAFIAYATTEIIAKMNDHQFLRFGLNEEWVRSKKLRLTRQLDGQIDIDKDPNTPPDPRIKNPAKFIVLSDDPKVIIESLIDQVARRERSIPQVILTDMNHNRTNTIRLEMNDDWSRTRPLTAQSVVKTLFVYAQIMNQPVALESTFLDVEQPKQNPDLFYELGFTPWWIPRPPPKYIPVRIKTTVTPNGEVSVHRIRWNGSFDVKDMPQNPFLESSDKYKYEEIQTEEEIGFAKQLKQILDGFILQLKMTARSSAIDNIAPKTSFNMQSLATQTSNQVTSGLFEHVPTAASAIAEWESYVEARSQDLFEFALKNNQLIRGSRGVSFRVLPEQPYFRFDQRMIQEQDGSRPVRPVDKFANALRVMPPQATDPDGNVRPVEGGPGDTYWDEDPNAEQGEGEGEGEGDEGDEDSDGSNAGKGSKDPRYVQVPLDKYAKALEEIIKLPNLRPKLGITRTRAVEYTSLKATQRGTLADEETFAQAYQMGYARLLSDGKTKEEIGKMKKIDIAKMGLGMMQDPDFRARDSYPIPNPDINALVTIVLDLSGSMDPAVPAARQMIYDLRAILMRKYKGIKFQFVSFDSKAHIFKSLDDFLRTDLSGGTEYSAGLEAVKNTIYPAHPPGQWDRFLVVMGDFADYAGPNSKVPQLLEELAQDSQYTAGVLFDLYNITNGELFDFFNNRSKSDEYVGFLKINPPQSYNPVMFRELFKNDAK